MTPDTAYDVVLLLLPILVIAPGGRVVRRRRRDEVFAGITPGELPGVGQQAMRRRVGVGGRSGPGRSRSGSPRPMG